MRGNCSLTDLGDTVLSRPFARNTHFFLLENNHLEIVRNPRPFIGEGEIVGAIEILGRVTELVEAQE